MVGTQTQEESCVWVPPSAVEALLYQKSTNGKYEDQGDVNRPVKYVADVYSLCDLNPRDMSHNSM